MSIELTQLAIQNREILEYLDVEGSPASIDAFARALGRDPSNFRKTLRAMETEGWVAKGGEGAALQLTPAGGQALQGIAVAEGRLSAGLPPLTHDQISPDPDQPRKDFESLAAKNAIGELAKSIAERGLLQPIRVRMTSPEGAMIEVGESRWRAIGLLIEWGDDRWPADRPIPYTLAEADAPTDILLDQLVENVQRRGLHPLEEADGYRRLRDAGISVVDIATKVGKDRRTIEQRLDLLNLPADLAERMRLPKDDDQHVTTARARELLQHLRRINEQAQQRDIEEIAPGGVSAEDEGAAAKVRLDPLELLALGEIAAAVAAKPSTKFPHSPTPVVEVVRDAAVKSDRLIKLTLGHLANLIIDKDQEGEPAGVRMEPLGHIRLRQANAHPADNPRALFHLRREAGFSADQARNLANLGRYVSTWLNPPAASEPSGHMSPPLLSADRSAPPASAMDRAERFSEAVQQAAVAEAKLNEPERAHWIRQAGLNGKTTIEGETWPDRASEELSQPWDDYPRVRISLTSSDWGRWAFALATTRGGPDHSGQSSPPYVHSGDPIFRSRTDALAAAREVIIERLGEVWGRKRKLLAWLDGLDAQTDREIEEAQEELDLAAALTREELAEPQAETQPAATLSDVQLRILGELFLAIDLSGEESVPVGRYWLDLDAVGLWKLPSGALLQFTAAPGEHWTAALTEAGVNQLAVNADRLAKMALEAHRDEWGRYETTWLNAAQIAEVRAAPVAPPPQPAAAPEDEADDELLTRVREELATGRPDFPALMQAVGLEGAIRVSGDASVEVHPSGGKPNETACVVDPWRDLDEGTAEARAHLIEWALELASGQVQLALPEGDDTPDRALYRAARAMQDFLLRAIPPATPLFMEVAEPYERLSIALNKAIWAADHPKPAEDPQPTPELLLAFKPGDLVTIGGTASAYRLLERVERNSHSPTFLAQQVMLKTGKDYGEPRTITLHAIQGLVPASAIKGAAQ